MQEPIIPDEHNMEKISPLYQCLERSSTKSTKQLHLLRPLDITEILVLLKQRLKFDSSKTGFKPNHGL